MEIRDLVRRHSRDYNFIADARTGFTFRWGRTEDENPRVAPWPELVDISITNRCHKGCPGCYRDSRPDGSDMTQADWELTLNSLISPAWGPVFQVAFGGGEPTLHPALPRMMADCRSQGIVPNYTTNGSHLSEEVLEATARFAGAVAVSWHGGGGQSETLNAVRQFKEAQVEKVNIHFLLSNSTFAEALAILSDKSDWALDGVNAIVFLTAKPKGRCPSSEVLDYTAPAFAEFLALLHNPQCQTNLGIDPCLAPALIQHTDADLRDLDTCEGAFFSLFIDEQLNVKPCSFADDSFTYSLRSYSLDTIWGQLLEPYRQQTEALTQNYCTHCRGIGDCRGVCRFYPELYQCQISTP